MSRMKIEERCGGIVRTLFNTQDDGNGICYEEGAEGTYYLILDNVTPIMSIAIGVDHFYEMFKKHNEVYYEAIKDYNSRPTYADGVTNRVEDPQFIGE